MARIIRLQEITDDEVLWELNDLLDVREIYYTVGRRKRKKRPMVINGRSVFNMKSEQRRYTTPE